MRYFAYIIINPAGKTYVGQTGDISRRLAQHNNPEFQGTLYTKRNPGPWKLLHCEEFNTRAGAMTREKELKTGKGREWIRSVLIPCLKDNGC